MAASLRKIRDIFMDDWDPIGVKGAPGAVDEYDSYIMPLYSILRTEPSGRDIIRYLRSAENRMGLSTEGPALRRVAQKLLQIDLSHDEHHE